MSLDLMYTDEKLNFGAEARKAIIDSLNLSEAQKALVNRYYQLAIKQTISDQDVSQIEYIWEKAATDGQLAEGLGLIDDWHPPCLAGEELISENRDIRIALRDHIPLLAEEKLKRHKGVLEELQTDRPYISLFCPDGSGIVHLSIQSNAFTHINDNQICDRCHKKFSDHEKFINTEEVSYMHK